MLKPFRKSAFVHAIFAPVLALAASPAVLAQEPAPPAPSAPAKEVPAVPAPAPKASPSESRPAAKTPEAETAASKPVREKLPAPPRQASASAADAVGVFRIASYNTQLLFDDKDDPNTEDEQFGAKAPESLQALADVIKAMDAEIVGLQEVENREAVQWFLDNYLPDSGYKLHMDQPANSIFNVALLSRLPVKRAVRFGDEKGDGPGGSFRYLRHRMVAFEVEVAPDYEVWVLVVHLKAMSDERSQKMRADMARAARGFLENTLGLDPKTDNIAIIGDYNDTPDSDALKVLTAQKDYLDTGTLTVADERTHSSNEPSRQIDYVVVSWGLSAEFLPDALRVPSEPSLDALRRASDHLPVIAAFMARDAGPTGEERQAMFNKVPASERAKYVNMAMRRNASDIIKEQREEQLADALSQSDAVMSLADARANFLALEKEGKSDEAPVMSFEGYAVSDGNVLGGDRAQFGFSDASGSMLVDAPNYEHFPTMPKTGDRLRVVGKVIRYRDILELRPLAPSEILPPGEPMPEFPTFAVDNFDAEVNARQGGRVVLEGGVVDDVYRRRNGAVKYTLRSKTPGSAATAVVYVTQNLPVAPPQAKVGQEVWVSGVVSSYQETPQLLVASTADFVIVAPKEGEGEGE